jgi:hypothetical protein
MCVRACACVRVLACMGAALSGFAAAKSGHRSVTGPAPAPPLTRRPVRVRRDLTAASAMALGLCQSIEGLRRGSHSGKLLLADLQTIQTGWCWGMLRAHGAARGFRDSHGLPRSAKLMRNRALPSPPLHLLAGLGALATTCTEGQMKLKVRLTIWDELCTRWDEYNTISTIRRTGAGPRSKIERWQMMTVEMTNIWRTFLAQQPACPARARQPEK